MRVASADFSIGRASGLRVFFNRQDITSICGAADDAEGWVDVVVSLGERLLTELSGTPLLARIFGNVRIEQMGGIVGLPIHYRLVKDDHA